MNTFRSVLALRVRDFSLKEMYGEWASGASPMPAIVAEMQAQGHYAHLYLAKSAFIQKLTVLGLKSSHEHRHGGKTGGVAWSDMVANTEAVVAQYFGELPEGTKYVVANEENNCTISRPKVN
mmetsp:Transcript_42007/g.61734  ORF Transcript_42007/g.61734 Transcript_42007/m.61734 type:complete len:122 (+) Transcript_42007:373-738(+)